MPLNKAEKRTIDLNALIEGLCEAGVEFIVVGGIATVIHGAPVTTMDLDIVHRQTDANIRNLLKFLKTVGAHYRRPDEKVIEPDEQILSAQGHSLLSTCFGPLDVLAIIEGGHGYDELKQDSVEIEFRGYNLQVLSLAKIIKMKRNSKYSKDLQRLPILKEWPFLVKIHMFPYFKPSDFAQSPYEN